MASGFDGSPSDLRQLARKRIEDRRGFVPHLLMYVLFNAGIVFIWALTANGGFFWPGFVMFFWGIGVVMHFWSAFISKPVLESDVDREVQKLRGGPTPHAT